MHRSPPHLARCTLALLALIAIAGCSRDPLDEIRSLQDAGKYQESIEPLETQLEKRPDDAELQYRYGIANLQTGKPSLALWPLRKARENAEWKLRAGDALARAAFVAGDTDSAIEAATRVLEEQPENLDTLKLRAEAHLRSNRYEVALPDIERIEALEPDDGDAPVMRLQALIGMGRLDEAEALFTELDTRAKDQELPEVSDERYCAARATFAREKDDPKLAEQRFEECLKAFPNSPLVVRAAIDFFDGQQRRDRSNEILRAVLALEPSDAQTRELLAVRLRDAGQPKEAEALLLEGTKLESETAVFEAWGGLASHYFQVGDFAASVSAWDEVLKRVDEPNTDYLFGYAEALLRAGRYDQALEVAGKLPEPNAEIIRGLAWLEQKQPAKALQHFDAGLRLWPNQSVARFYAAVAAERAGDFDRAIEEYRQSMRSGARDTDAGLRLAELHEAEGAIERAYQAITMHLRDHQYDVAANVALLRIASERSGRLVRVGAVDAPDESRARFAARAAEVIARHGDPATAIAFLEQMPGLDFTSPRDAEALSALVVQLAAAKQGREARERAEKALAAHPDTASFHAIRALALEQSGGPPAEVRAGYSRALELDPKSALALSSLGRLDAADGSLESAIRFYERAAEADPADLDSQRRAAEAAMKAGKPDEARRLLEALLEQRPYDGESAARLGALLVEQKTDPERARLLARQAVRFGGGPQAYALLAETHLAAGEAERAVAALQAAADLRPADASLRYQLGRALAAAGRQDAAREAFEKALAGGDFPERNEAVTALAALPARAGG